MKGRAGYLVLGVLGVTHIVVSVLVWTRAPGHPLASERAAPVRYVDAVHSVTDEVQPVDVALEWTEAPALTMPIGGGTLITAVFVTPGVTVRSGDPVLAVDGRVVSALATSAPLHRDVTTDATGADVEALARAMVDLGLLSPRAAGSTVTEPLRRAIRAFNTPRTGPDDTLRVADIVWLPRPEFVVDAIGAGVRAGVPSPSPGSPLVTARPAVSRAALRPPEDGGRLPPPSGPAVLDLAGARATLDADGVTVADLTTLSSVVSPSETIVSGGVRRLAEGVVAYRVPSNAVLVGADGTTCVLADDGTVVEVEVVDGGPGFTLLARPPTRPVAVNPLSVVTPAACGSAAS